MITLELEEACVSCGSVISDDEAKEQENMCFLCHDAYLRDQAFIKLARRVLRHPDTEAIIRATALLCGLLANLEAREL